MSEKIDQFFREDGSLISIPAKSTKRLAVLARIALNFESGRHYPEKELNTIIATYHDDTAAIRRYMIENQILERSPDGVYWLNTSA